MGDGCWWLDRMMVKEQVVFVLLALVSSSYAFFGGKDLTPRAQIVHPTQWLGAFIGLIVLIIFICGYCFGLVHGIFANRREAIEKKRLKELEEAVEDGLVPASGDEVAV